MTNSTNEIQILQNQILIETIIKFSSYSHSTCVNQFDAENDIFEIRSQGSGEVSNIFLRSEGRFSRAGCTKSGAGTLNSWKPNFSHLHRISGTLEHLKNQSAGVQGRHFFYSHFFFYSHLRSQQPLSTIFYCHLFWLLLPFEKWQ